MNIVFPMRFPTTNTFEDMGNNIGEIHIIGNNENFKLPKADGGKIKKVYL